MDYLNFLLLAKNVKKKCVNIFSSLSVNLKNHSKKPNTTDDKSKINQSNSINKENPENKTNNYIYNKTDSKRLSIEYSLNKIYFYI